MKKRVLNFIKDNYNIFINSFKRIKFKIFLILAFDILFYFISRGINLLRNNGRLGFIVSRALLKADKARKLRDYILRTCKICPANKGEMIF